MPDRIDLGPLGDHLDAAQQAVAALAGGALVGLNVEGYPALLASATAPRVLRLLQDQATATAEADSPGPLRPPTLLLADPTALRDWLGPLPPATQKLPGRVWPGPVRLLGLPAETGLLGYLPPEAQALLADSQGRVAFQVPHDQTTRAIVSLLAGPALLFDRQSRGWSSLRGSDLLGLILDAGPPTREVLPTVVGLDPHGWNVVQAGLVAETELRALAGTILLFVCTGNTCRSPMAAALCRNLLAHRLRCGVADLAKHGITIESAGVGASPGASASTHAVTILRDSVAELGLDPTTAGLSSHRSQPLTADLVRRADWIFAMTWDHLDAIQDRFPEALVRVRLLDPHGSDIPDPYGSNEATYRTTASAIYQHLIGILRDLGLPAGAVEPA